MGATRHRNQTIRSVDAFSDSRGEPIQSSLEAGRPLGVRSLHNSRRPAPSTAGACRAMPADDLLDQFLPEPPRHWTGAQ